MTILPNSPAAEYTVGPNGTASFPGQSSHTISFTNNGAADYMLLLSWNLTLDLAGHTASAGGAVGQIVAPNQPWILRPNPTNLSTQGDFAPGTYSVSATTQLFGANNGLTVVGAGAGRTFVVKPRPGLVGPIDDPTLPITLIGTLE